MEQWRAGVGGREAGQGAVAQVEEFVARLQETGVRGLDGAGHLGLGQRPRPDRVRRWRGLAWRGWGSGHGRLRGIT